MYLNNILFSEETIEIVQQSIGPLVKGAITMTIPLSIVSFVFGLVLALITALFRLSGNKLLTGIARIYISIIRGTPLLVQLFIIFYGLPNLNIIIDPIPAAIIGFSLNVGAYAAEIIRAAILSVPKGQWEAAYNLGMSYVQVLRRVVLPQASRISVPPLANSFISLVKDTSLASVILVAEMFRKAQEIAASNFNFLVVYCIAAFVYWVICFVLSILQDYLEERLSQHVKN